MTLPAFCSFILSQSFGLGPNQMSYPECVIPRSCNTSEWVYTDPTPGAKKEILA
jgi:hypothetical protein